MPLVSHQTIRLSPGKHISPMHGACVMELASMLAGEQFSDHPQSVSPPIAAFLRNYNDHLDDYRRQDLYSYAARVVGTASSEQVERRRSERLVEWGEELRRRNSRGILSRVREHCRRERRGNVESAAREAIRSALRKIDDELHASALALIDELIEMGSSQTTLSLPDDYLAPARTEELSAPDWSPEHAARAARR